MKRTLIILMLVGALMFALVGCGGKSESIAVNATPAPEYFLLLLNTEGRGQIDFAEENEALLYSDVFPKRSAQATVDDQTTYVIGALADEGAEFVKWTLNGEDYSRDPETTVRFTSDAVLIAVFDNIPEE